MKNCPNFLRTFFLLDVSATNAALLLAGALSPLFAPALNSCDWFMCWIGDLFTHWQWLYLAAGLWLLARGDGLTRILSMLTAALAAYHIFVAWTPLTEPDTTKPVFRVIQANVNVANPSPSKFLAWVRDEHPDVIVIEEVSPIWEPQLKAVTGYPYFHVLPSTDSFGMAILSRHPLRVLSPQAPAGRDAAFKTGDIDAVVDWNGQPVRILATHPMPPIRNSLGALRDKYLAQSAQSLTTCKGPALLVGDFNATPWSAAAHGIRRAGMELSSAAIPTWPNMFGVLALIPIDHVALSPQWAVVSRERGPDIGSDHFPIRVDLSLKNGTRSREATSG